MGAGEPVTPPTWDDLTAEERAMKTQELTREFTRWVRDHHPQLLELAEFIDRCVGAGIVPLVPPHDDTGFPPGEAS
jgi:hypothetical protein